MVIGSNILAGSSGQGGGYNISRSLRFRKSASAYLSRTFTSAGNRKTWTWSGWIKKSRNAEGYELFGSDYGDPYSNGYMHFNFQSSPADALNSDCGPEGSRVQANTTAIYRDPSAWYHIVIAFDTTQATSSNRIKYYVNGVQQTMTGNYPSQNYEGLINTAGGHSIGYRMRDNDRYFDGCMTEIHFIDGQALTPSSFGETSTTTGVWIPKRYTGTYGTNGFYLSFSDNTSTTTLGADSSGNGNNWTCNNISLTSGSTYDSMTDVPTLTSATAANFPTMNPLIKPYGTLTPSEANLKVTVSSAWSLVGATNTLPLTGKYYWEFTKISGAFFIGLYKADLNQSAVDQQDNPNGTIWYYDQGNKLINGATTAYGATYAANDVIGVAVDMDAQSVTFYKNNVSQGAISFPSNMQGVPLLPAASLYAAVMVANFGQRPFTYTPPTGYVALNTYNLPTPTIGATASSQANKYFDVATWTGANTNGGNSVSSLAFSPDLVWTKIRSQAYSHLLYDRLRGTGATAELSSDQTVAEGGTSSSERGYLNSFDTNGFSSVVGSNGDNLYFNQTSQTYVAWNWKANGSGSSNTSGSITSTVSANTTAGFSIVTYTSTTGTVGHGLGVAPSMIIMKGRNVSDQWTVGHKDLNGGSSPWNYGLPLNSTASLQTNSGFWNNTAPTSTVFSQGSWDSGYTKVAYCFAEVAGFSKFGSYTGNGSSDGAFVYTGFRPKFVLIRSTSNLREWFIVDTSRNTYNVANTYLRANTSSAEGTDTVTDMLSNGFKLRNADSAFNGSGETYIYMAFAENPFKYSLAR